MDTSDYRGASQSTVLSTQSHNIRPITPSKLPAGNSYVDVTKSTPTTKFPKKDQAIILNAIESCKLSDYIQVLANIIGPKNILFASRITNNRICIYLVDSHSVDNLLSTHKCIIVNDTEVGIRRLVTPAKRLVLSNVCPSIPHDVLINSIKSLNLKPVSPITFLKAGIPGEEFSHILSFRRQLYILPPEDENKLPSSILITFEDTSYRIFITTDDMSCFLCKQKGHIANTCPNVQSQPQESAIELTGADPTNKKRPAPTSSGASTSNDQITSIREDATNITQPEPIMSPPTNPIIVQNKTRTQDSQAKVKRLKRSTPTTQDQTASLRQIKDIYEKDPSQFPIEYASIVSFLENSFGNSDPLTESKRFTNDANQMIATMHKIYPHLTDRALKSRITRIISKLRRQLDPPSTYEDGSSSQYEYSSDLSQDA